MAELDVHEEVGSLRSSVLRRCIKPGSTYMSQAAAGPSQRQQAGRRVQAQPSQALKNSSRPLKKRSLLKAGHGRIEHPYPPHFAQSWWAGKAKCSHRAAVKRQTPCCISKPCRKSHMLAVVHNKRDHPTLHKMHLERARARTVNPHDPLGLLAWAPQDEGCGDCEGASHPPAPRKKDRDRQRERVSE